MGCRPENLVKFNEMGWQCLYYSTAWISGVYLSCFSRFAFFYFENGSLARTHWWKDYPNHPLYAEHKLYYLLQLAFWIHMVFVTVRGRVGGDDVGGFSIADRQCSRTTPAGVCTAATRDRGTPVLSQLTVTCAVSGVGWRVGCTACWGWQSPSLMPFWIFSFWLPTM